MFCILPAGAGQNARGQPEAGERVVLFLCPLLPGVKLAYCGVGMIVAGEKASDAAPAEGADTRSLTADGSCASAPIEFVPS